MSDSGVPPRSLWWVSVAVLMYGACSTAMTIAAIIFVLKQLRQGPLPPIGWTAWAATLLAAGVGISFIIGGCGSLRYRRWALRLVLVTVWLALIQGIWRWIDLVQFGWQQATDANVRSAVLSSALVGGTPLLVWWGFLLWYYQQKHIRTYFTT